MPLVKNSWSGASFGQADVKGCYHCGRMVRDERGAGDDPTACGTCIAAGYKMPPTLEEQQKLLEAGGDAKVAEAFAAIGPDVEPNAVPTTKNPSDVVVHKADNKELLQG